MSRNAIHHHFHTYHFQSPCFQNFLMLLLKTNYSHLFFYINSLIFVFLQSLKPNNFHKIKQTTMAQSLSNLNIYLPLSSSSSAKTTTVSSPLCLKFPCHFKQPCKGSGYRSIKAMAGETRDNLDHLQRARQLQLQQQQQQQPQPKKRVAQVAPLGLWDRFPTAKTVQQMMDTMESIMEDPLTYSGGWPSPTSSPRGGYSRGRTPWEIKEGEGEYKMRFDMPGMTKDDVKVWVEEKMLVVKAEKVAKKKKNSSNGQVSGGGDEQEGEEEWSSRSYGRYSSRIALPENVEFEKIKAEVKDGVLYITIPKAISTNKVLDINVQ